MARSGGGQVNLAGENTAELRRDLVVAQPKKVTSNSGPPYSSRDFARYATQGGRDVHGGHCHDVKCGYGQGVEGEPKITIEMRLMQYRNTLHEEDIHFYVQQGREKERRVIICG